MLLATYFVIKHIGAKEVKTIVEKGELYIDYMVNRSEKPSCLAKILGVFQVQMKQNETVKSHYIIMEDIFYGKTISKTYDLKGSRRNRMSKEEHIFLDSNYINQMRDHPVYIDKASQLSKSLFSISIKFKTNFKYCIMQFTMIPIFFRHIRSLTIHYWWVLTKRMTSFTLV